MNDHPEYHECPYCGAALDPDEPCDCVQFRLERRAILTGCFDVPDPAWKGAGMEDDPLYLLAYGESDLTSICPVCGEAILPGVPHSDCAYGSW